jgi:type I restriction enzyme R subunit
MTGNYKKEAVKFLVNKLGTRSTNCFTADLEDLNDKSGRTNKQDVVFFDILQKTAIELNPDVPVKNINDALNQFTDKRYAMSLIAANRDVYNFIKNGISVEYENDKGKTEYTRIKLIDYHQAYKNDFCAVTLLWIKGERYPRRPDIIIYINGIPLVSSKWKKIRESIELPETKHP